MFFEHMVSTFSDSYLLSFMLIYTIMHLFHTFVIDPPPRKLKEGEFVYGFLKEKKYGVTSIAFYVLLFNMIALPIASLSSSHYWIYIASSTILMAALFVNELRYSMRGNRGNEGMVAFAIFPLWYFPAVLISVVLHLFGIGQP